MAIIINIEYLKRRLSRHCLSSNTRIWHLTTFLALAIMLHEGDAASTPPIPALLVFGDSIVDTGNNNYLTTILQANFPPYGRDFMGHQPTGRFSNGRIPSDLFAEALGVKKYVPPYLDPTLMDDDLITGVSFASGASGYDPFTAKLFSVLSLSEQLDMFKEYVKKITTSFGEEMAATVVSESVYLICTGSDDIANTYFLTPLRRFAYDVPSYTNLLANFSSAFFQLIPSLIGKKKTTAIFRTYIYRLGARRIGVVGAPPVGCLPTVRTLAGGLARACSEPRNQAARLFNSKIASELNSLNQKFPKAKFVLFDLYSALLSIIENPNQYGFEVGNRGCCGTGNFELGVLLCTRVADPMTCPNATKFVFWDGYHLTERTYEILVKVVVEKYLGKLFQN